MEINAKNSFVFYKLLIRFLVCNFLLKNIKTILKSTYK